MSNAVDQDRQLQCLPLFCAPRHRGTKPGSLKAQRRKLHLCMSLCFLHKQRIAGTWPKIWRKPPDIEKSPVDIRCFFEIDFEVRSFSPAIIFTWASLSRVLDVLRHRTWPEARRHWRKRRETWYKQRTAMYVQRVLQYLVSSGKRMLLLGKHSLFKIANSQRCVCVCESSSHRKTTPYGGWNREYECQTVAQTSPSSNQQDNLVWMFGNTLSFLRRQLRWLHPSSALTSGEQSINNKAQQTWQNFPTAQHRNSPSQYLAVRPKDPQDREDVGRIQFSIYDRHKPGQATSKELLRSTMVCLPPQCARP